MNKKRFLLLALLLPLAACSKTNELYQNYAFNSTNFDECYYHEINMPGKGKNPEWNNVDKINVKNVKRFDISKQVSVTNSLDGLLSTDRVNKETSENYVWDNNYAHMDEVGVDFGASHNLGQDKAFQKGYLSKLFDGRTQCYGKYQKTRVQINKTGFATYFPKVMQDWRYFAMSLRGGSDCNIPLHLDNCPINLELSFYLTDKTQVIFEMKDIKIWADNGGTVLLSFYKSFIELECGVEANVLSQAEAFSLTFTLNHIENPEPSNQAEVKLAEKLQNVTDDLTDKTKNHFALMIYEVMLPDSFWL